LFIAPCQTPLVAPSILRFGVDFFLDFMTKGFHVVFLTILFYFSELTDLLSTYLGSCSAIIAETAERDYMNINNR